MIRNCSEPQSVDTCQCHRVITSTAVTDVRTTARQVPEVTAMVRAAAIKDYMDVIREKYKQT